jgi:hypothetical protein
MAGGGIMSRKYRSWLAPQFERFVALKRAGGYHFVTQENLLLPAPRHRTQRQRQYRYILSRRYQTLSGLRLRLDGMYT